MINPSLQAAARVPSQPPPPASDTASSTSAFSTGHSPVEGEGEEGGAAAWGFHQHVSARRQLVALRSSRALSPAASTSSSATATAAAAAAAATCDDSCAFARDGVCDEPGGGSTEVCPAGTDCTDCAASVPSSVGYV